MSVPSPFLFKFFLVKVTEDTLGSSHGIDAELVNRGELGEVNCANDLGCLLECTEHVQLALDKLARTVASFCRRLDTGNSKFGT